MTTWQATKLADVVTLQRGHDLPASSRHEGDVPVIGSFGITGFHSESRYKGPGVAIGRSGASIGVATFCKDDYWPLNTCLFVRDFHGNDPRWVYYLLDSIDFSGFNSGSAQPSLNRNYLAQILVDRPPVAEQREIAATLGALDDKVESNRRVCAALDELSRMKFREWRSQLASAKDETFGSFAQVFGGATPSTSNPKYWGGGVAWATPTDVTRLSEPYVSETARTLTVDGLESCTADLHPVGTILMTSRATIGSFAINRVPMATNQGFIAVRPTRPEHRWFLFEEMRSRVGEFIANANGSTFLELSRGSFKALPLSVPSPSAIARLDEELAPLHARAAHAAMESKALISLRDALLPELLKGRLRAPVLGEA